MTAMRSGKIRLFISGVVLGLISLAGCVSNNSRLIEQPMAEKRPALYIYRPNSFSNVVVSPTVIIDGKQRFLIGNNKYEMLTSLSTNKASIFFKEN